MKGALIMTKLQPTRETYTALQDAFDYFNRELFHPELPQVLIVLRVLLEENGSLPGVF